MSKLTPHLKKLLILWLLVLVIYAVIVFFSERIHLSRYSIADQQAAYYEAVELWCTASPALTTASDKQNFISNINLLIYDYDMIITDLRQIILKGSAANWPEPGCLTWVATYSLCTNIPERAIPPQSIGAAFGLNPHDVQAIIDHGLARGDEPHPCYLEEFGTP